MTKEEYVKDLILESGYSLRGFAEAVGIPNTTLLSILKGGLGGASVQNVIKICKGLSITVEDLLDVDLNQQEDLDTDPWLQRLRRLVEESGKSHEEIAAKAGMSAQTLDDILDNKYDADDIEIEAIMEALGKSVDDLVETTWEGLPDHALEVAREYLKEDEKTQNIVRRVLRLPERGEGDDKKSKSRAM